MTENVHFSELLGQHDESAHAEVRSRVPVIALGLSLGLFFAVTYVLCVLFDLWLPSEAMRGVWEPLLPWFTWLNWPNFFLGLAEVFVYGWYIALVFGPIYNYACRFLQERRAGRAES